MVHGEVPYTRHKAALRFTFRSGASEMGWELIPWLIAVRDAYAWEGGIRWPHTNTHTLAPDLHRSGLDSPAVCGGGKGPGVGQSPLLAPPTAATAAAAAAIEPTAAASTWATTAATRTTTAAATVAIALRVYTQTMREFI